MLPQKVVLLRRKNTKFIIILFVLLMLWLLVVSISALCPGHKKTLNGHDLFNRLAQLGYACTYDMVTLRPIPPVLLSFGLTNRKPPCCFPT